MLKLEGLSLAGFKSFADRTDITFPSGITCVVGPNGCGKSNVVDAIAWVLGEQSPRQLRGSKMEEVIFAGTRNRKPAGSADVTLRFSPKPELLPQDDDIDPRLREPMTITRRLYRNGDSEYLINDERSRLKDIQALIMGTGMGTRVYSIIEQGRVGQILQAKPTDRRILIEEAAGITRYKARRKAAKLKLDESERDLLRVTDISAEVEKQLRSLRRQVGAARRYRTIAGRRRVVLRALHATTFQESSARLRVLEDEMARLSAQAAESAQALSALEHATGSARDRVADVEARRDGVSQQSHGLHLELERAQHVVASGRERLVDLDGRARRMVASGEGARATSVEAQARVEERRARLAGLDAELAAARGTLEARASECKTVRERLVAAHRQVAELKESIFEVMSEAAGLRNRKQEAESARARLEQLVQRLAGTLAESEADVSRLAAELASCEMLHGKALENEASLRGQLGGVSARLEGSQGRAVVLHRSHAEGRAELNDVEWKLAAVEETARTRAAWGESVRRFLEDAPEGVLGAVADFARARAGDELAVEKALGPLLQAVVVGSRETAEKIARGLAEERRSQIHFVFPDDAERQARLLARPADKRILGDVAEAVTFDAKVEWLARLVPSAWLVAGAKDALVLARRHPDHAFVSRDGVVVGPGGQGSAGRPLGESDGILETQARKDRLDAQVHERRARLADLTAQLAAAEGERDTLAAERLRLQVALAGAERETLATRHALSGQRQSVQASESRHAGLAAEHEVTASELALLGERMEEYGLQLAAATMRKADLERAFAKANDLAARLEGEAEGTDGELSRLREEAAVKAERREAARLDVDAAETEAKRCRLALDEVSAQVEALEAEKEQARALVASAEAAIADGSTRWQSLKAELEKAELHVREGRSTILESAERLRDLRLEHERRTRLVAEVELQRERLSIEREHGIADCREKLAMDPSELPLPVAPEESADAPTRKPRRRKAVVAEIPPAGEAGVPADGENVEAAEVVESEAEVEAEQPVDESLPWIDGRLDVQALIEEADDLRQRLDRIGPVNLVAIEEYDELSTRHAFLSKEQSDLTESIKSLRRTIHEIDALSRERFQEAFEAVRVTFDQAFQTLFRGGRAELRLQEEEDPLECGIEIIAQPPGKRLQNMMLLSGGEKALTAIALLFALFRYKPSPFCVLDEVDAPLDEPNTLRFLDLVETMSVDTQFVLVTHARRSMERGKVLYGVTMQDAGVSKLVSVRFEQVESVSAA